MNKPADTARTDADTAKKSETSPSGTTKNGASLSPPPRNVDKEGGASVDELDLDGDGARQE